jgi:hypothetical protein
MDTLKKIGFAWVALIIIFVIVLLFYFTKITRCSSVDFVCDSAQLYDTRAALTMRNHLHDAEIINITSSCKMIDWNINSKYKYYTWDINKEMQLNIYCQDSYDSLDISMIYMTMVTNITHTDFITVRR